MSTTPEEPSLRAVRLVKRFGDGVQQREVLHHISFDLFPGQLALLMGPSGSGKSTLVAVLSGLLSPESGQVLAKNGHGFEDVWAMGQRDREEFRRAHTGFIFQGYNLFPALTASQQLEIVLRWGGRLGGAETGPRVHARDGRGPHVDPEHLPDQHLARRGL